MRKPLVHIYMSFRVKRGILSLDYWYNHKYFSVIASALPYLLPPCSRPAGRMTVQLLHQGAKTFWTIYSGIFCGYTSSLLMSVDGIV